MKTPAQIEEDRRKLLAPVVSEVRGWLHGELARGENPILEKVLQGKIKFWLGDAGLPQNQLLTNQVLETLIADAGSSGWEVKKIELSDTEKGLSFLPAGT